MLNLLIGDIGGTNARLELCRYDATNEHKEIIKKVCYKTSDYETFDLVLTEFLESIDKNDYPQHACIAICGPVLKNSVSKMFNTPWKDVSGDKLAVQFAINDFLLINDFHAVGLAHKTFNDSNLIQLNKNADMSQEGVKLFVGFGTGVGVCAVNECTDYSGGIRTKVLTSESASTPLGCKNKFDFLYQQFIRRNYDLPFNKVPTIELLIGSKSIRYMYEFFKLILDHHKNFKYENKASFDLDAEVLKSIVTTPVNSNAKEVIDKFKENDNAAVCTVKYFLELLGNALFILCVAFLPTGGIFLMGPVLFELFNSFGDQKEYFIDHLIHNYLLDSFLNERFRTAKIALYNHKNEPGIKGALAYIKKKVLKPKMARLQTM